MNLNSFPGALSQIITNLIVNALKHAFEEREKGTVTIVFSTDQEGYATIKVDDDGIGIAAENTGRIFEPFFTTKRNAGGTGLGLSIVHNLAHSALGGTISVRSKPGEGTCFTLVIPQTAPAPGLK